MKRFLNANPLRLISVIFTLVLVLACTPPVQDPPAKTWKVTYAAPDATGGTVPVDASAYTAGSTVTVVAGGDLAKTGYLLTAWNTAADGTGTVYAPGATLAIADVDITLYAVWSKAWTISCFEADKTTLVQSLTVLSGTNAVVPSPSKDMMRFKGWLDGETDQPVDLTNITEDKVIYPLWAQLYKVNVENLYGFKDDNGNPPVVIGEIGEQVNLPDPAQFWRFNTRTQKIVYAQRWVANTGANIYGSYTIVEGDLIGLYQS